MSESSNPKSKSRLHPLIIALVMASGITLGYLISVNTVNKPAIFSGYEYNKLNEVMKHIDEQYVDSVSLKDLEDNAIQDILHDLDPHSYYIPPVEAMSINEDMQGNFEGIGVQFRIIEDTINIEAVIEGGPSEKIGIQAGDQIVEVEDSVVAGVGVTNEDVMLLLKGPSGTKVKVTVLRGEDKIPFIITRDKIPLYSVDAAYMLDDVNGYIKVNRFVATTYTEFVEALDDLTKRGMQNLVLDLRGNPGGYLIEAVYMIDEILDGDKLIVYTEGLHYDKYEYTTERRGLFEKGDLVILIDENSASASEIFAGAIQDWDRGTIVGRRSFGKGLVQDQIDFPDNSALRLTIARYYTPSGRCIQKPYDDIETYYSELDERYLNGELVAEDSSAQQTDTTKYYTLVENRVVYGGGGIVPDVFVPMDTSYLNLYVAELRSYIPVYIYKWKEEVKDKWSGREVNDFVKNFNVSASTIQDFYLYAQSEGYKGEITSNSHYLRGLKSLLKANLARQLYDTEAYYRVMNHQSPIIEKALEQF